MKCSDFQRVLLDDATSRGFQLELESHLESCPDCSDLVSDLELISREARQLEATEEPAPRVWVRIAAELRAEGIIREPESAPNFVPKRPVLVSTSPRRRWSALWLAPVATAVLAAGAFVISHKPVPTVAKVDPAMITATTPSNNPPRQGDFRNVPKTTRSAAENPASSPANQSSSTAPRELAKKSAPPAETVRPEVEPESSADDQQFLSVVSTRAPAMRATYENQLQAVNADIRETQAYVDRNPGDADARQHLMDAYEQKALLYQIALDRIQ
jgi:hypothetical protein